MSAAVDREVFSVKEVAQMFGVSDSCVYRLAQSGAVRVVNLGARRVLFPKQEIERILQGEGLEDEEFGGEPAAA